MNWIRQIIARRRLDRDLAEELQSHLEEASEQLAAEGLPAREAHLAARRAFGNVPHLEDRARDVWRWRPMEEFLQDVRFAIRQLRKTPAFTLAGVLTLALGIGANTAVFSVVNAVLLRPLPFRDPDRLVSVQSRSTRGHTPHPDDLSYPTFFDFRRLNHVFDHLVCYRDTSMGLSGAGEALSLRGQIVSWDLFDALGVRPAPGRGFLPEEERGARVVVLSHQVWKERFGGDPALVGRSIDLDRRPFTVVGIAPAGFNFPIGSRSVQFWTTLAVDADSATVQPMTEQRGARLLNAIARLKPGIPVAAARAGLDQVAAALALQYPDDNGNAAGTYVLPEIERVAGDTRDPILLLLGAVGLVLLVACANVANLLLARTAERLREFAVRASIGASRARVVRQLLTEGFTFALAGSVAGLLLAAACLRAVAALAANSIPRIEEAGLDGRVLAFSTALAFLTSILFSVAPALRLTAIGLAGPLKQSARGNVAGKDRLRSALVVVQIALGLILLSGASILTDGFLRLMRRDAGFRTNQLLTFRVSLPRELARDRKHLEFEARLLDRLRGLPGVANAATAIPLPLTGHQIDLTFHIDQRPTSPSDQPHSDMAFVSPSYFRTIGVPLLAGRLFTEADDGQSPPVLVVNRAFAQKFFPGESALGKRIEPGATAAGTRNGMREIVGVVGDARQDPTGSAPDPIYYYAAKQLPWCCPAYVLQSSGSPLELENAIRHAVSSIDATAPVHEVRTMDDLLSSGIARPRFQAFLLGSFAAIALLLTAVGLYGVLTYSVLIRTREIGVRVALGAGRGAVLEVVLKDALVLVGLGVAAGSAGSIWSNRLASRMAAGAGAPQLVLLLLACGTLVAAASVAAYFPARRAAGIDPIEALRSD